MRRPVNKRGSSKSFDRRASKTHPLNKMSAPRRGGIRL